MAETASVVLRNRRKKWRACSARCACASTAILSTCRRLSSPADLAFLAGHDGDAPLGQDHSAQKSTTVLRTRVSDLNRLRAQSRFLEELRQGIRDGISRGLYDSRGGICRGRRTTLSCLITRWAALRGIQHPDPEDDVRHPYSVSTAVRPLLTKPHTRARVPVSTCPLERNAQQGASLFLITAPDARTAD